MHSQFVKAEHTVLATVYLSHQLPVVDGLHLCMLCRRDSCVECTVMAADTHSLRSSALDAQRTVLFQPIPLSNLSHCPAAEQIL